MIIKKPQQNYVYISWDTPHDILCMCPANEGWRYIVTSSLIGWVHTQ